MRYGPKKQTHPSWTGGYSIRKLFLVGFVMWIALFSVLRWRQIERKAPPKRAGASAANTPPDTYNGRDPSAQVKTNIHRRVVLPTLDSDLPSEYRYSGDTRTRKPFVAVVVPARHSEFPQQLFTALTDSMTLVQRIIVVPGDYPELDLKRMVSRLRNERLVTIVRAGDVKDATDVDYAEMCNAGAAEAHPRVTHILFLSPTHFPTNGGAIVDELLRTFTSDPSTGVVGCTAFMHRSDGETVVLEHGMEVGVGWEQNQPGTFMVRRLNGFGTHDARVFTEGETTAVSPYCMMTDRKLFDDLEGMMSFGRSIIDHILYGSLNIQLIQGAKDILQYRIVRLETLMGGFDLSIIHSSGPLLRQRVRDAYAEVVEATTVWEELSGKKLEGKPTYHNLTLVEMEKKESNVEGFTIEGKLAFLTQRLQDAITKFRSLTHIKSGSSALEDECGWDYSFRAAHAGKKILVSNATVVFQQNQLPMQLLNFAEEIWHRKLPLFNPSYLATGKFAERWAKYIKGQHPALQPDVKPIRVVWEAYCCTCCGFSNEIVHLVFPLHKSVRVDLMPGPQCFCPGFPASITDAISRMHTTPEQYMLQGSRDDEIVVWISHTDPLSYVKPIFSKRKPDYLVGRSMYEFTVIWKQWADAMNKDADEIWVPCEFVRKVFENSGVNPDKLVVIGEALDTNFFDPGSQGKLGLPLRGKHERYRHWCNRNDTNEDGTDLKDNYKFFSSFKWEPRKGWDILFGAYFSQFSKSDRVSLYITSHIWFPGGPETYGDARNTTFIREEIYREMRAQFDNFDEENLPHFCILTQDLTETEVVELYNEVDAFVLPTRGEGWGLPSIQAMSMALPTISTDWGGQTEFMKPWNSFLIELDAVEEISVDSVYGYLPGKKWATPSFDHTKQLMRYVFENREHAIAVGRRARQYIVDNFSEESIAKVLKKRLLEIKDIVRKRERDKEASLNSNKKMPAT